MEFNNSTCSHRHKEIEYRPCEDYDIVDVHPTGHDGCRVSYSCFGNDNSYYFF